MTKIFIEGEHGPRHNPTMHTLQNIICRSIKIAIDIRKCQGTKSVIVFFLVEDHIEKVWNGIPKQALIKDNVPVQIGNDPSRGITSSLLVPPGRGQAGKGIESVNGNVQGQHLLQHADAATGGDPELANEAVLGNEGLGGVERESEHISGAAVEVEEGVGGSTAVPSDVAP